ncbi:hypothetical protein FB561_4833 [Kribbella amoyensis]|uniref:Uncharacterized protein n=1 Tax=Kribbella amoyensis TaxID=996641 RepID=A0A561BXS7_9ACTN|nr:hypothetical protein FB561_4833 [Kribbella amoyensis]
MHTPTTAPAPQPTLCARQPPLPRPSRLCAHANHRSRAPADFVHSSHRTTPATDQYAHKVTPEAGGRPANDVVTCATEGLMRRRGRQRGLSVERCFRQRDARRCGRSLCAHQPRDRVPRGRWPHKVAPACDLVRRLVARGHWRWAACAQSRSSLGRLAAPGLGRHPRPAGGPCVRLGQVSVYVVVGGCTRSRWSATLCACWLRWAAGGVWCVHKVDWGKRSVGRAGRGERAAGCAGRGTSGAEGCEGRGTGGAGGCADRGTSGAGVGGPRDERREGGVGCGWSLGGGPRVESYAAGLDGRWRTRVEAASCVEIKSYAWRSGYGRGR